MVFNQLVGSAVVEVVDGEANETGDADDGTEEMENVGDDDD